MSWILTGVDKKVETSIFWIDCLLSGLYISEQSLGMAAVLTNSCGGNEGV